MMMQRLFTALAATAFVATASVVPRESPECETIAALATQTDDLSTLVSLVNLAGLGPALSDENATLTVFAPTNSAFNLLDNATVAFLTDESNVDALTDVLLYHVLKGTFKSANASNTTVEMLNGADAEVTVVKGTVFINDAMVVTADIEACNGIIHVIDAVLLPPSETECQTIAAIGTETDSLSTLVSLVGSAGLGAALDDKNASLTVFAPTNAAFSLLSNDTIAFLTNETNIDALTDVLLYHIFDGVVTSSDASDAIIEMLNGDDAEITVVNGTLLINDAKVVVADVEACNGVVHVIDAVLSPPSM